MKDYKIILAGLASNKTSLGEIFRRYISCFQEFSTPDIFDLSQFIKNDEFKINQYPQFTGKVDHDLKYFHCTFGLYRLLQRKASTKNNKSSKKVGYFVWESSELHKADANVLHSFDEIWTASSYCKQIFSQYIDEENIKVIPHPIPIPSSITQYRKNDQFTILIMGNISSNMDRKNVKGALEVAKVLKETHKDIRIIFKTFTVSDEERLILKNTILGHEIAVIDEYYPPEKVQELIGTSHILLSLHRSEGFGLTLAEAIAVGTVPIATGYSGNMDFIQDSRLLIDYNMTDAMAPYFKGQWAEPSVDDAIHKTLHCINDYHNIADHLVLPACLSPKNVANTIQHTII